jgi:hypothetical protein
MHFTSCSWFTLAFFLRCYEKCVPIQRERNLLLLFLQSSQALLMAAAMTPEPPVFVYPNISCFEPRG